MITKVPWSAEAESRMDHPAAGNCLTFLRREVEQGIAALWKCEDGKDRAYMVTRLDSNPSELVICYFQGSGLVKFGAEIVAQAHAKKIPVRIHTVRAGIVRMARRLGLVNQEIIMRSEPT